MCNSDDVLIANLATFLLGLKLILSPSTSDSCNLRSVLKIVDRVSRPYEIFLSV
jgi:hypothetical protein